MGETHDIRRDAAATSDKKNLKAPDAINSDIDSMLPTPTLLLNVILKILV